MSFWNFLLGRSEPAARAKSTSSQKGFQREDLRRAALDNLWPIPTPSNILVAASEAELQNAEAWISEKREWVNTLGDADVRRAYEWWISHAEYCVSKCRKENSSGRDRRKEYEEWSKKRMQESRDAAAIAKLIPAPPK